MTGEWTSPGRWALTAMRLGISVVGLALLLSFWASPDRLASLPWFALHLMGVVLALVVTGPLLDAAARKLSADRMLWFFLAAGYVTLAVTLFASRWPAYKLSWLNDVYAALPSIRSLPWWWIRQGLQPNQTGGMLALCTAFAFAVATDGSVRARHRWPAVFLTVAGSAGVFMTGSRAALAGLVVAALVVLMVRTSRWLWAWGASLLLLVSSLLASEQLTRIVDFFVHDETLETKLIARLDIWTSAISGVQDHFFTGIGLGVFNQVMPIRYPYQTVGLFYPVSQAHNLLLDTALAIGIPGAIGLALLVVGAFFLSTRGIGRGRTARAVSLGIVASLIVFLTFGLTDSIGLSTPTSFIVWLWVCSIAVLSRVLTVDQRDAGKLD